MLLHLNCLLIFWINSINEKRSMIASNVASLHYRTFQFVKLFPMKSHINPAFLWFSLDFFRKKNKCTFVFIFKSFLPPCQLNLVVSVCGIFSSALHKTFRSSKRKYAQLATCVSLKPSIYRYNKSKWCSVFSSAISARTPHAQSIKYVYRNLCFVSPAHVQQYDTHWCYASAFPFYPAFPSTDWRYYKSYG